MKVYQDTELPVKLHLLIYIFVNKAVKKQKLLSLHENYSDIRTFRISEAFHSRIGKKCIHQKRKSVSYNGGKSSNSILLNEFEKKNKKIPQKNDENAKVGGLLGVSYGMA